MRIKKAKREDRRSGETRGKDPDFKKEKKKSFHPGKHQTMVNQYKTEEKVGPNREK